MSFFVFYAGRRLRSRRRHIFHKRQKFGMAFALAACVLSVSSRADDVKWTLNSNGKWNVAANWTDTTTNTNHEPTSSDEVTNDTGKTVILDSTGYANDYTTSGDLTIDSGTLTVNHLLDALSGSVVHLTNHGILNFAGDNATVRGEMLFSSFGTLSTPVGKTLTIDSGALLHGQQGFINLQGDATHTGLLINNGTISADAFQAAPTLFLFVSGSQAAFTNNGVLDARNGGSLNISYGRGGQVGGTLQADGVYSSVTVGDPYNNSTTNLVDGVTVKATNGGVVALDGLVDGQNHSVDVAAGLLTVNGLLKNATINTSGTGQGMNAAGTLENVTINGSLIVSGTAFPNGSSAFLRNNVTVRDRVVIGQTSSGSGNLIMQGGHLTTGEILFNAGTLAADTGTTLTIDASTLVHGQKGTIGRFFDTNANKLYNGNLVNNGTISADVSGETLSVSTTTNGLINNGIIEARNGGNLYLAGGTNVGGTIRASGAGSSLTINGTDFVDGMNIQAESGSKIFLNSLFLKPNKTLTLSNAVSGGDSLAVIDGKLVVAAPYLVQAPTIQGQNAARVAGTGILRGDLDNEAGVVAPGAYNAPTATVASGIFTVTGNYKQGTNGVLRTTLGNPGAVSSLLVVDGTASLAGTLQVVFSGTGPQVGQTFDFLRYGARVGTFSSIFSLNNGYAYDVIYNDATHTASLSLHSQPVPEPTLFVSLSGGLVMLVLRRRRRSARRA